MAEAAARALRPAVAKPAIAGTKAGGAAGAAGAAGVAEATLSAGSRVTHLDKAGIARLGHVAAVHMDDDRGAYYTVALEDASERCLPTHVVLSAI